MNILLIEDNTPFAISVMRVLSRRGHAVQQVDNTRAAQQLLDSGWPDLVLTDRHVADGDAWAWARARPRASIFHVANMRVVFMSGRTPDDDDMPPLFYLKGHDTLEQLCSLVEGK